MLRFLIFILFASLSLKQVATGLQMPVSEVSEFCSPCDEGEKEKEGKSGEKSQNEDKFQVIAWELCTFVGLGESRMPVLNRTPYLSFLEQPKTPPPNFL